MPMRLFSAEQTAALLGAAVGDVTRWMRKGWLPFQTLPEGAVRISERGLLKFLRDRGIDIGEIAARISQREAAEARAESAFRLDAEAEPARPATPLRERAMASTMAPPITALPERLAVEDPHHLPPAESGPAAQRFPLTTSVEMRPLWRGPQRTLSTADRFPLGATPATAIVEPTPAETPAPVSEDDLPSAPPDQAPQPEPTQDQIVADTETTAEEVEEAEETEEVEEPVSAEAEPTVAEQPSPPADTEADVPEEVDQADEPGEVDELGEVAEPDEPGEPDEPDEDTADQTGEDILTAAAASGASEIYLQPGPTAMRLRLRVDGTVRDEPAFETAMAAGRGRRVVEHFRSLLGDADQGDQSMRTGSLRREVAGRLMRLDLSSWPTVHGAAAAITLSAHDDAAIGLAGLHLAESDERMLRGLLSDGSGMVVMAARPHSPGMAALREMLAELNTPDRLVMAVARFQEIRMDGVAAVRLARGRSPTCAETIHLAMSRNADVILVENLRDPSTALAALDAAEEGRLVLAGMSAPAPPEAARLLLEMGCEPWPLASTLRACLAYRSVRALCGKCKQVARPCEDVLRRLGLKRAEVDFWTYEARGCEACSSTGYSGRIGLLCAMLVRGEVTRQLRSGGSAAALADAAAGEGMLTPVQAGLEKAREGVTSLGEVLRLLPDAPPSAT